MTSRIQRGLCLKIHPWLQNLPRTDQFFSRDMSQIVGKCHFSQYWRIVQKFLDLDLCEWVPKFIQFFLVHRYILVKFSQRSDQQFWRKVANSQTDRQSDKHRVKHNLLDGGPRTVNLTQITSGALPTNELIRFKNTWNCRKAEQDAQLSQRDRAAGCVIVFAKSRRLELGDNISRTL